MREDHPFIGLSAIVQVSHGLAEFPDDKRHLRQQVMKLTTVCNRLLFAPAWLCVISAKQEIRAMREI